MYGSGKKGKIGNKTPKRKFDEDTFAKFARYGQLKEVG